MENKKFHLCAILAGLGYIRLKKLLEICGSIEKIFTLSLSELKDAGIPKGVAAKIEEWERLPWKEELEFCERNGISIITLEDKDYPAPLKQIFDPPILLFVKGVIPAEGIPFAIVGTRNPSAYGIRMAEKFAAELAYYGFVIVSGMARGVDTAAHNGALRAAGKTVAVTGCGFRQCYPAENRKLSEAIAKSGAVITEFVSNTPPEPQNFPRRNRIVSGLSKGVLVVEAGQKSGALITAHLAADQGREVFALPGRIDALYSKGANQLLKEGAALVETVEEIISGLNLEIKKTSRAGEPQTPSLSADEQSVFKCIKENGRITVDGLLVNTGMGSAKLFQALLALTVKNLIAELPGKLYTPK
jgi:DNA processing protein